MSLKILLADDSLTAQNMGRKILTDAGYEVIAVSNGAQAIKKIVSELPDLVVLDVYMPGYSGVELCERIRQTRETATTPVVLSVGKMEPFRPEETTRVRADGLIIKPFEASELLAVVKKLAEKVAAAPLRRKPAPPEPASEPAQEHAVVEAEPATTPAANGSLDIPHEIAATPAIGMELIAEASGPASGADQPPTPLAFEVEHAPEASVQESHPEPRMEPSCGLSGVFEIEPVTTTKLEKNAEATPTEEGIERFSAAVEIPSQSNEEVLPTSPEPLVPEPLVAVPRDEQPQAAEAAFESTPDFPANTFAELQSSAPGAEEDFRSPSAQASFSDLGSADSPVVNVMQREQAEPVPSPVWDVVPAPAARPVWVAEEIRLDPEDCAISLHEQMRQAASHATAASLDVRGHTDFDRQVEWTPARALTPGYEDLSGQEREYFRPDFSVEEMATAQSSGPNPPTAFDSPTELHSSSVSQSEPAPAKIRSVQEMAAEEAAAAATAPNITSAVPDPKRIASIVEQVLERLKPELIAAVARELEKKQ